MDPKANLEEQLRLASKIVEAHENDRLVRGQDVARLADLIIALDEWIRGGGFSPWEGAKHGTLGATEQ